MFARPGTGSVQSGFHVCLSVAQSMGCNSLSQEEAGENTSRPPYPGERRGPWHSSALLTVHQRRHAEQACSKLLFFYVLKVHNTPWTKLVIIGRRSRTCSSGSWSLSKLFTLVRTLVCTQVPDAVSKIWIATQLVAHIE